MIFLRRLCEVKSIPNPIPVQINNFQEVPLYFYTKKYSNLPNNCVGPFIRVAGRLINV